MPRRALWRALLVHPRLCCPSFATSVLCPPHPHGSKWAKHFPSFHTADVALSRLLPTAGLAPTALVSNFAAPHLLHVHPIRPFFDADSAARPNCYPQSTCADLRGLLGLQTWITADTTAYRSRLGKSTRLVVMTPNWICDGKLYDAYRRQLALPQPRRDAACRAWLIRRSVGDTEAAEHCERSTFTGDGTLAMSTFMSMAAQRLGVRVLDATEITRGRCNATEDARHYPPIVPGQAARLVALLS